MPETKDWIFASSRMHGKQPLWPEAVLKNHIRPAAKRAGVVKHITWHAFRHSFSTLLIANKNDVKTVQHLMRHTNPRITLELYTGAVDEITRRAQSQIVRQMLPGRAAFGGSRWEMPEGKAPDERSVSLLVYRKNYTPSSSALQCGGDDGTRTRGLCRDRAAMRCNCLISNGVGGRRLIQDGAACHFISSP